VEVDHPVTSKLTYAGAPVKAGGFFKMRRPAPILGQHSEEIYGELGCSKVYAVCKSDTFWPTYLHPGLNWWRYSYIWRGVKPGYIGWAELQSTLERQFPGEFPNKGQDKPSPEAAQVTIDGVP
jgi:hypothetical protein